MKENYNYIYIYILNKDIIIRLFIKNNSILYIY